MGLVGLVGGGYPSHDYTTANTAGLHDHPYGTQAIDSSGGIWVYAKASTTVSSCGVVISSSALFARRSR